MLAEFEDCDRYGVLDANKSKFSWETQKFYAMMDTLCLCQFAWGPRLAAVLDPWNWWEFCKYAIDWDTSIAELQEIGERRIVMMRLLQPEAGFWPEGRHCPEKSLHCY